jgi:membrane protein implicated in regulation of membrane protease activity
MTQLQAGCVVICGFAAIVAGAIMLGGTAIGLIVFGTLTVASAALLYNPKAKRDKKNKTQKQPWPARSFGSR